MTEALQRALATHQAGRLAEAEQIYRTVLAMQPDHPDALHLLGVAAAQRGELEAARDLLSRARRIDPQSPEAHVNFAGMLTALGRHEEALANYDRALVARPGFFEALHERGVTLRAMRRYEEALECFDRALRVESRSAVAYYNRGLVQQDLGRNLHAVASYDQALAIAPGFAEAMNNRGRALADMRRFDEALASWDRAIAAKPDFAEARNNRAALLARVQNRDPRAPASAADPASPNDGGGVRSDVRNCAAALATYDEILAARPDFAEAWSNRGIALNGLRRFDDALASFARALEIKPDLADALSNRAATYTAMRRYPEALADLDRALAIDPLLAEAHNNRGAALAAIRRHDEALACYERALEIRPMYADALNNRAAAMLAQTRNEEALRSCDRALEIVPDFAEALDNRGVALLALHRHAEALASLDRALAAAPDLAGALRDRGALLAFLRRHDEACRDFRKAVAIEPDLPDIAGSLLHSQMHCCDWTEYDALAQRIVVGVRAGVQCASPFHFLGIADSAQDQRRCAETWARAMYPPAQNPFWTGERYDHDRIRVAYLSADFHDHATAHLVAGLLERHDRARFAITAVSYGPDDGSAMRARLQSACERFVDVRQQSDADVAQWLRDQEFDIAVDLKGYTAGARPGILARRPAPVQVSYLGYPGTLGAEYIDYVVADAMVIPAGEEAHYVERVVRLPECYQVNDARPSLPERGPTRSDAGLPAAGMVFCSFNSSYKITPTVFAVWMRLLHAVEGSVLWLLEGNSAAPDNLRRVAVAHGIAPDRLIFAPVVKHAEHLSRQRLADLFLDTLPVNAHTTASDALSVGLPVVTCAGNAFAGRVAASVLRAAGLPELVTSGLTAYEALALRLATQPKELAAIRAKLVRESDSSPLFDTDRFRRHLESAYVTMRERSRRGEPPAAFDVAPLPERGARGVAADASAR